MSEPKIADAGARREALDVSRSFIVQAPAGSGKTELLIQRYLRLLGRVQRPEEILAITFTRKAAAEMRTRILGALERARSAAAPEAAHERVTWTAARAVLERDAASGWHLARFPERMQIQTLDAFNARIAAALPVTSGIGGVSGIVGEGADSGIYTEAARAVLDSVADPGATGDAVRRLFLHLDNDALTWERALAAMLRRRDQWLEITGAGPAGQEDRLRRHFEASMAMLIEDKLQALDRRFPVDCRERLLSLARFAARELAAQSPDSPIIELREQTVWPGTTATDLGLWQALALLLLTGSGSWRRRVDRRLGFPPGSDTEKSALAELIGELAEVPGLDGDFAAVGALPAPRYSDSQWEVLLALLTVLPQATAELKLRFATAGVTDYVEIALAARDALGRPDAPTDLALALDYRIRHVLIDEMQDTSLGQYALIETLTAGWDGEDGRTLFCVGDPMQSIYRFRQAEVGLFLALRTRGIGALRPDSLTLATNFRSGGQLVAWANRSFSAIMPARDDLAVGAIRHSPSTPAPGREGYGECRVHALPGAGADEEAERVLAILGETLDGPGDATVAVLVRSRTHLRSLLPLLRGAGIDYQAVEIDRLTDLPEIQDLLALTRALIHPLDRIAWLGLLRGPWCGISLAGLHSLVVNDGDSAVLDLAADPDRLAGLTAVERESVARLHGVMTAALAERGIATLRDRVERLWLALGGAAALNAPAEVHNAYRFLDILEKLEAGGTLADVALLESQLDEERVSGAGAEGCRLSVMTIHKAKGLEFDTVVLTGLGRRPRGTDRPVLNWLTLPDERGHEHLLPSPIGARADRDKDRLHEFIHGIEREKERLELDRLLYVACTRARQALHLVGTAPVRDGTAIPAVGSLLERLWPSVADEFESAPAGAGGPEASSHDAASGALLVAPRTRRLVDTGQAAAPAPAVSPPALSLQAPAQNAIEYDWVGQDLRHVGTVVHAWLQRMPRWGGAEAVRERLAGLRPRHEALLAASGVGAEGLTAAADRVEEALSRTLGDPAGRWVLFGPHRSAVSELALEGIEGRRLVAVVLDRCFVDRDGRHWIIDYKTSRHEGGELERFLAEEARRYRDQIERYRRFYAAVSGIEPLSALYFPLHARLVPMDEVAETVIRGGLPG